MFVSPAQLLVFFLILARIIGLFTTAPILSDRAIPQMFKLSLAIWITIIFSFVIHVPVLSLSNNLQIGLALIGEFFIGFTMGFITRIIFVGVQMAGSLMDMQMGLSAAASFDPSSGGQTTIMERLMFYFTIALIFIFNAHHLFFVAIFESFKVIPLVKVVEFQGLYSQLGLLSSKIFLTALSLSMPLLVIIFILDFSLGLLARLAPQVNVFNLGFQIKPMLGLWIFVFTLPMLSSEVNSLVSDMMNEVYKLLASAKVL